MHLKDYLSQPEAPSVSKLRQMMNDAGARIEHDAQIRQWLAYDKKRKRFKRQPGPQNCVYLEHATGGTVDRRAMRPHDYAAIWPDLAAPALAERPVAINAFSGATATAEGA
jgi:DNA-binding transcriptional regulator YdaS (Cro superfamily)